MTSIVEKQKRGERPESEGVNGVSENIVFLLNTDCVTQDGWS